MELLNLWDDRCIALSTGAMQVFPWSHGATPYYDLEDYVVSSAVSGPSLILVPRKENTCDSSESIPE